MRLFILGLSLALVTAQRSGDDSRFPITGGSRPSSTGDFGFTGDRGSASSSSSSGRFTSGSANAGEETRFVVTSVNGRPVDSGDRFGSSGSDRLGSSNSDRFGSSGTNSDRFGSTGTGSDRVGASGSDRFGSSGSDRFGSSSGSDRDRLGSSGSSSDRFSGSGSGSDRVGASGSDRFGSSGSDRFGSSGSDRIPVGSSLRDRDDSRFVVTDVNRGGSGGSRVSGSGSGISSGIGSGSSSSGRFTGRAPDFFRIEVEVQRLENQKGILGDGKSCDLTGGCDPRVLIFIDTQSPDSPFPGPVPTSKWAKIFEATDQNSVTIGKATTRDVCGGDAKKVNARVLVEDADSISSNDIIGQFDCPFNIDPRDIARDSLSAQWSAPVECVPKAQKGQIRLFARLRAYEITSSNCKAAV